jgi:hypothetical protein
LFFFVLSKPLEVVALLRHFDNNSVCISLLSRVLLAPYFITVRKMNFGSTDYKTCTRSKLILRLTS